jgi:hypothetical protein
MKEAVYLQPYMKKEAEKKGELKTEDMIKIYFDQLINVEGPYRLLKFESVDKEDEIEKFFISLQVNDKKIEGIYHGKGPIESVIKLINENGIKKIKLIHYEQTALDESEQGSKAKAMTVIELVDLENENKIICRGLHDDTSKANLKAIINGLNIFHKLNSEK